MDHDTGSELWVCEHRIKDWTGFAQGLGSYFGTGFWIICLHHVDRKDSCVVCKSHQTSQDCCCLQKHDKNKIKESETQSIKAPVLLSAGFSGSDSLFWCGFFDLSAQCCKYSARSGFLQTGGSPSALFVPFIAVSHSQNHSQEELLVKAKTCIQGCWN